MTGSISGSWFNLYHLCLLIKIKTYADSNNDVDHDGGGQYSHEIGNCNDELYLSVKMNGTTRGK